MTADFSLRARKAAYDAETNEVWVILLTITHTNLSETIRVCSDSKKTISRANEFLPLPFAVTFPNDSATMPYIAQLMIDNIEFKDEQGKRRTITTIIRTLTSPPTILLEVVLSSQPDVLEAWLPLLKLSSARTVAETVSASLTPEIDDGAYPVARFTPLLFPGGY